MNMELLSNKVLLLVLIFSLPIYLLSINTFQIGEYMDDARYIVLAKSIAYGYGYKLINYPSAPLENACSFGYPLLLAPLILTFPHSFISLQLLSIIATLVSIIFFYLLIRKRLKAIYVALIISMFAFNSLVVGASILVMSEAVFLMLILIAIYLIGKSVYNKHIASIDFISILAIVTMAFYVRMVGFTLVLAGFIYYAIKRNFSRAILFIIIIISLIVPWIYRNYNYTGSVISTKYEREFFTVYDNEGNKEASLADLVERTYDNFTYYASKGVGHAVLPLFGPKIQKFLKNIGLSFIPSIVNIILFSLIIIGWIYLFIVHKSLLEIFFPIYIIAVLLWNESFSSERFLYPAIPFLYYFLFVGIQMFNSALYNYVFRKKLSVKFLLPAFCCFVILLNVGRDIQEILNPVRNRITDISIGTTWIDKNTPSGITIMCKNPISRYLYVRRFTVGYPSKTNTRQILNQIGQEGIDYIIISPKLQCPRTKELDSYTAKYFLPTLLAHPDKFLRVYRNEEHNVSVYEVVNSIK